MSYTYECPMPAVTVDYMIFGMDTKQDNGSKSLAAFIVECNRGSHIFFLSSVEEGLEKLKES